MGTLSSSSSLQTLTLFRSFKGTDVTFEQFPDRLRHVVHESLAALDPEDEPVVESKVFPVFETKGELVRPLSSFSA